VAGTHIAAGWITVIAMPERVHRLAPVAVGTLPLGGILYSTTAVIHPRQRPDPNTPGVWLASLPAGGTVASHSPGTSVDGLIESASVIDTTSRVSYARRVCCVGCGGAGH
jgi:predicted membrane channel-forming protein YqfA (hemolysin III family)